MAPPPDRGTQPLDRHILPVRERYSGIFTKLLRVLTDAVRTALTAPPFSEVQRREEYRVRSAARRAHEAMGAIGIAAAQQAVLATAERGSQQAIVELRRLGHDPLSPIDSRATRLIQDELAGRLHAAHLATLREPEDIYRRIISQAALLAPGDDGTRRLPVAQHALDRFAEQGITGFVDRSGRRWDITSYVEMATRTAASRAYTDAHSEWLLANGRHLVYITDVPGECEKCRPFEGAVLRLDDGPLGERFNVTRDRDGTPDTVTVSGTLAAARAAGLLHPACRHRPIEFEPGMWLPAGHADPEGEAARAHLRYLERGVRRWKLREAAALDDLARKAARRKVRAWQAAIRQHVATAPVSRVPRREQIDRAR